MAPSRARSPVVYRITTEGGKSRYTGVAQRGHVRRGSGSICPAQIHQMPSIDDAKALEARIITRSKPPHNKYGK